MASNENLRQNNMEGSAIEQEDFDETLSTEAIDREIKRINERLRCEEIALDEAMKIKSRLEEKRSQVESGSEIGENILRNIDDTEDNPSSQEKQFTKGESEESNFDEEEKAISEMSKEELEVKLDEIGEQITQGKISKNEGIELRKPYRSELIEHIRKENTSKDIDFGEDQPKSKNESSVEEKDVTNSEEDFIGPKVPNNIVTEKAEQASSESRKEADLENNPEDSEIKEKYLGLKREFKEAKTEFQKVLKADLENNGSLFKKFGFGRENMSKTVQEQYDLMMETNAKYMQFAESNGIFDKINERLHRDSEKSIVELQSSLKKTGITIDELRDIKEREDVDILAQKHNLTERQVIDLLEESSKTHKEYDVRIGIQNRHVVNPAKERLKTQSLNLPPFLSELKNMITDKTSKHPKVAKVAVVAFGTTAAVLNPFAVLGGFATRYTGEKLFINKAEARVKAFSDKSLSNFYTENSDKIDLEQLEKEYFKGISDVDKYKVRTNAVAAGVALGSAVGAEALGLDTPLEKIMSYGAPDNLPTGDTITTLNSDVVNNIPPSAEESVVSVGGQDSIPTESEIEILAGENTNLEARTESVDSINEGQDEGGAEMSPREQESIATASVESADTMPTFETHEVVRGDTLSEILFSDLEKAVESGKIELPDRVVGEGGLSSYMYERFPEFTGAEGVEATLSPEQWRAIGVDSGNPHLIYPGEKIDINALVEIMNGTSPKEVIDGIAVDGINIDSPGFKDVPSENLPTMYDYGQGDIEGLHDLTDEPKTVSDNLTTPTNPSASPHVAVEAMDIKDINDYYTPEVSPEKLFTMSESAQNLVSEFLEPSTAKEEIFYKLVGGVKEGDIVLPKDMVVDGVDYRENIMGLVEKRLPELSPEKYPDMRPALRISEWTALGVPDGDPARVAMQEGDKLMTGRLMQFVLSGDKSVLFPKS